MAELKTRPTKVPVVDFINGIPDESVRQDCWRLIDVMQAIAQAPPVMWGSAIVGFGQSHLTYASGRVLDWPVIAFSPRKQALTLYLNLHLSGPEGDEKLLQDLGKHTRGKGCLYIKRLSDVDPEVLKQLVQASYDHTQRFAAAGQQ